MMHISSYSRYPNAAAGYLVTGFAPRVLILMVMFMLATAGLAQSTFGTFVGTVKDPSGAIVADCLVTLTNTGTSAARSTISDKDGNYVLVNIDPGMYKITIRAPG